jgi:nucleotide-binding universal stress UspA family protein
MRRCTFPGPSDGRLPLFSAHPALAQALAHATGAHDTFHGLGGSVSAYNKIIVGTDGSATSLVAVERAGALAADNDAPLLIVTAYEGKGADDKTNVVGSAPAQKVLDAAAARAEAAGATKVETQAIAGPPVDVLDQAVADSSADLLVIGNVGLNTLTGRVLGSVPQSVARRAGVDVLVVHTS